MDSLVIRSMRISCCLMACPWLEYDPLMHMLAEFRRENDHLHLIQPVVELYGCSHFVERREASLLYVDVAAHLTPPVLVRTSGMNVAHSISLILCS